MIFRISPLVAAHVPHSHIPDGSLQIKKAQLLFSGRQDLQQHPNGCITCCLIKEQRTHLLSQLPLT